MFKDKKLIIFDMDGTLLDSAPSLAFAINFMLQELNLKTFPQSVVTNWVGQGADILVKRALVGKKDFEKIDIPEDYFNKAKTIFLDFYGKNLNAKTTLYPNVIEVLTKLESKNYILALATNKPIEFVGSMLKEFNIEHFFKIYLGGGSVSTKKPDPEILLTIVEKLKISAQDSVMVGDSSSDILAAKDANIDSIALTYGYNQGVDLKELKPNLILNNFKDINNYFL